jgi:hypothetical protein
MDHRVSPASGFPGSLQSDFRALAAAIVPEAAGLDEAGWRAVEGVVADALASRPERLRRQFRLFIRLLGWISMARYGSSLASLDARRRERFLSSVERSRLLVVRRGFWGLRTLVFLGYWTRPEAAAAIGYRARAQGWSASR